MKQFIQHTTVVALMLGMFAACQNNTMPPATSLMEQDSLIAMIDQKIEEKERQQAAIDRFRRRELPKNFSQQFRKYLPVIRKYTQRYEVDWRLTIAQILKESHFKESALSHVGAKGLMQIMPQTARQITREIDIAFITKDPQENITAGIYYMSKLFRYFPEADESNRIKLALAAYNCGAGRIYNARDIARIKNLDPNTWEAVKKCLPLLRYDDWSLHLEVWEQGAPTFGYFYGYDETIDYVDDIIKKYEVLAQMYKADIDDFDFIDQLNATM